MKKIILFLAIIVSTCAACEAIFPTKIPIEIIDEDFGNGRDETLMIFLPGRGGRAVDYIDSGAIDIIREMNLPVDVKIVDAVFGYYIFQTLSERLQQDVVIPARAAGYKNIWLVGISMGGLGALLYQKNNPGYLNGLLVMSPFLGYDVYREVAAAGGLAAWKKPTTILNGDYERFLWDWLKINSDQGPGDTPLYIGYSRNDTFVDSNSLVAEALPVGHAYLVDGGHDWPAWRAILKLFLENASYLPKGGAAD